MEELNVVQSLVQGQRLVVLTRQLLSDQDVEFPLCLHLLVDLRSEDLKVFLRMCVLEKTLQHQVLWYVHDLPVFGLLLGWRYHRTLEKLIDSMEDGQRGVE